MDAHHNNIFITPGKNVMLLDWGAAAFVPLDLVDDLKQRLYNRSSTTPLHDIWREFVADHPKHNIEERLYNQVRYRAGAPNLRKTNADWLVLEHLYKKTNMHRGKKRKNITQQHKNVTRKKLRLDG
jgi:hypothetical protein